MKQLFNAEKREADLDTRSDNPGYEHPLPDQVLNALFKNTYPHAKPILADHHLFNQWTEEHHVDRRGSFRLLQYQLQCTHCENPK